jgi:cytochrome bd-type quinol oxidase subunit 2
MTLTAIVLVAGWLIFVVVGLSWFLLQFLREEGQRKPTTPKRNALYFLLLTIISLAWLALIVFSFPQGLGSELGIEDLICVLILLPVIAFSTFMVYWAGRRRNRILEKQKSNKAVPDEERE